MVSRSDTLAGINKEQRSQDRDHAADANGKPCPEVFRKITDLKVPYRHETHENHHIEAHDPSPKTIVDRTLNSGAHS